MRNKRKNWGNKKNKSNIGKCVTVGWMEAVLCFTEQFQFLYLTYRLITSKPFIPIAITHCEDHPINILNVQKSNNSSI